MKLRICLTLLIVSLCGCSLPKYKIDSRHHQIAANADGNYLHLYENNKDLEHQCGLNIHLESIMNQIKNHPKDNKGKRKVLISIHGGLNSTKSNYKRVNKHYKDANRDGYYPIFISWQSDAFTTLKDRYFRVRNGKDTSMPKAVLSSPFYLTSDLLRGVASIPESFWDQGAHFYNTHRNRITNFDEDDIQMVIKDFNELNVYYTERGEEKNIWQQLGYATRQVVPGVSRIVTTPLVEGAANKSWEVMLRRAKNLMYRQDDLSNNGIDYSNIESAHNKHIPTECEEASDYFRKNAPNGIVAQLMRAISAAGSGIEITLVGHSMGAIIANDVVSMFPEINFSKIIHMASADSIRNLMEKTVPVLTEKVNIEFYNLTLHPTNEDQEQSVLGFAPEGSLLIWLDDMLTSPETPLDRRAGRWENIKWAFPFFIERNNMHFKMFGLRNSVEYSGEYETPTNYKTKYDEPVNHGDFGDFKFWRDEFYWGQD